MKTRTLPLLSERRTSLPVRTSGSRKSLTGLPMSFSSAQVGFINEVRAAANKARVRRFRRTGHLFVGGYHLFTKTIETGRPNTTEQIWLREQRVDAGPQL